MCGAGVIGLSLVRMRCDNSAAKVGVTAMQCSLHAGTSSLEWTVNAYTLSLAVLLVPGGRLGDIFGRRKIFLAGVIVFAGSSAAIGFSTSTCFPAAMVSSARSRCSLWGEAT